MRQYRYDLAGNLVGVSLPNGEQMRYTYDSRGQGRLATALTPDGRRSRYAVRFGGPV